MTTPGWTRRLLNRLAPAGRADDLVGDLEEAHRERVVRRGHMLATLLTILEAIDMAWALLRGRFRRNTPREAPDRGVRAGPTNGDRFRAHGSGSGSSGGWRPGSARSFSGGGFSFLDFKLGLRMLIKYPGLTFVGGLAMAFSIWTGASFFELIKQAIDPNLGFPGSERLVGVQLWDRAANRREGQLLSDFIALRGEVRSLDELSAFHTAQMNLVGPAGDGAPQQVAEMTASGFRITGARPLLGRVLLDSDELATAEPVIVLGYGVWKNRFASNPAVVGKSIHLGGIARTVVGVMPEGFEFPVSHDVWTPLRAGAIQGGVANADPSVLGRLANGPRSGPPISMFGLLAEGVSTEKAEAELVQLTNSGTVGSPESPARIVPQVMNYSRFIVGIPSLYLVGFASSNLLLVLLLLLVCGNVALLMFARAAAREGEIVVRSALGAGRRRIIAQLFTEALVLAAVAAAIGLGAARYGLRWVLSVVEGQAWQSGVRLPFWFVDRISLPTILYACGLTLLMAVIAGVGPALRITGKNVAGQLRRTGGGGKQVGFAGVWTFVIVTQVAITIALPATAYFVRKDMKHVDDFSFGYPADEYLTLRLEIDEKVPLDGSQEPGEERAARYRASVAELHRRVAGEAGVTAVALSDQLPLKYHPYMQVEVDEGAVPPPDPRGHRVGTELVDFDYFRAFNADVLQGRLFDPADVGSGSPVVIVNEWFVDNVLGGGNPIGRRIRYVASENGPAAPYLSSNDDGSVAPSQWFQIVGVVRDLGVTNGYGKKGVYHPVSPGAVSRTYMIAHVGGNPMDFTPRLRQIAANVDPTLRLHETMPLTEVPHDEVEFYRFWFTLSTIVSGLALLLSLTCIYAVMAFTVERRTREIGIRVAMGSGGWQVARAIFKKPLIQVVVGVLIGTAWSAFMTAAWQGSLGLTWKEVFVVSGYALGMTCVCMLACVVPTRKALRVQPTEALRADG